MEYIFAVLPLTISAHYTFWGAKLQIFPKQTTQHMPKFYFFPLFYPQTTVYTMPHPTITRAFATNN